MTEFSCAPILLIGFNRPDFMAAQIAAVRAARPAKLYVAVDGPRADRPGEAEKCRAVRDCVKLVDWSCEMKTLFREQNLGCKMGVSGAITWFFDNEESGIVLEDDCRPTIDFLRFASEMLVRYRDDERIGIVSGFNHYDLQSDAVVSYHFSDHPEIWGWASWRRVWAKYDVTMGPYLAQAQEIVNASKFLPYIKRITLKGIHEVVNGTCNTWDYQFVLSVMANHWLSVVPQKRLIANLGIADKEATHTGGYNYFGARYAEVEATLDFPLKHPSAIRCDEAADRMRERIDGAIFPRGLTWLGCKLPFLVPMLSLAGRIVERCFPILFRL